MSKKDWYLYLSLCCCFVTLNYNNLNMNIAILSLFIPVMVTIFGCPNSLSAHTWSWMFNLNPKLLLLSFLHKNQDIFLFFSYSICLYKALHRYKFHWSKHEGCSLQPSGMLESV